MLRFYIAREGMYRSDEDYIIVNKCHLIFPYKRTSASALQYVEYLLYYISKFHGELGFINIFPRPNYKKRGEFVKIKNKFFIMLNEGSIYV
jgi:hypothetical protein